jgi:hypothetical protein
MLFRAVFASLAAATLALGAAVPESAAAPFDPSVKPLATPVYDDVAQPLTNAERLRRGMAPLPPKIKRFGMHAPGPVRPVPDQPEPSAAPPTPSGGTSADPPIIFEGIVQVADSDNGKILGYVSGTLNKNGQLGVDRDYRSPIEVTFKTVRANAQPGSIEITNGNDDDARSGKFFGAVVSEFTHGSILGKGNKSFTYLTRVGETKPGVGPMGVGHAIKTHTGLNLKAESSIWTANQFTGELAAVWTNPGGAPVETEVFYYKSKNALALSSDPGAFGGAHKDAVKVTLTIIPKPLY